MHFVTNVTGKISTLKSLRVLRMSNNNNREVNYTHILTRIYYEVLFSRRFGYILIIPSNY